MKKLTLIGILILIPILFSFLSTPVFGSDTFVTLGVSAPQGYKCPPPPRPKPRCKDCTDFDISFKGNLGSYSEKKFDDIKKSETWAGSSSDLNAEFKGETSSRNFVFIGDDHGTTFSEVKWGCDYRNGRSELQRKVKIKLKK